MNPFLHGWIACPGCGGDLEQHETGVRCAACALEFAARDGVLDLVDATEKVSSEGPGDTTAMAWRRRRWDELRGAGAPENSAYLAAIWEHLRPDDQVVDLGCGPGSFLGWLAAFAPDLAIVGLDLSWPALDEARRISAKHATVRFARASTRRRLPLADGSCDLALRRLAPALPAEVARVLAPGGRYLRFTFGPGHWREIYDRVPGLPRAREEAVAGEIESFESLGFEVLEPRRFSGHEEMTSAAVLLALRSNPAAFHMSDIDLAPMRQLWFDGQSRRATANLTTDYVVIVARKAGAVVGLARKGNAGPTLSATLPAEPADAVNQAEKELQPEEPKPAKRRRAAAAVASKTRQVAEATEGTSGVPATLPAEPADALTQAERELQPEEPKPAKRRRAAAAVAPGTARAEAGAATERAEAAEAAPPSAGPADALAPALSQGERGSGQANPRVAKRPRATAGARPVTDGASSADAPGDPSPSGEAPAPSTVKIGRKSGARRVAAPGS